MSDKVIGYLYNHETPSVAEQSPEEHVGEPITVTCWVLLLRISLRVKTSMTLPHRMTLPARTSMTQPHTEGKECGVGWSMF